VGGVELSSVVVYTKDGCHLCERVIAQLLKLRSEQSFEISIKDITTDSRLFERYKNIIPVVAINGKVRLAGAALANPNTLEDALRRALLRGQQ
jgi:glutaredoxin